MLTGHIAEASQFGGSTCYRATIATCTYVYYWRASSTGSYLRSSSVDMFPFHPHGYGESPYTPYAQPIVWRRQVRRTTGCCPPADTGAVLSRHGRTWKPQLPADKLRHCCEH